ncbi:MAG TPA: transposase [Tepidisphaeraceae bacterium]|nr:transposase [Tepidisphaeraceae bacterium]
MAGRSLPTPVRCCSVRWPASQSCFSGWKLMRWCDRHGVVYCVGLARNKRLETMAEPFMRTAWQQYEQTRENQRIFTEFNYAAGSWDRERRVIHKAEHNSLIETLRRTALCNNI